MSFTNSEETILLMQLSEEQAEIVSGGSSSVPDGFYGDFGISKTEFLEKASVLNTFSASGPEGSVAGGFAMEELIKTSGLNFIGVS